MTRFVQGGLLALFIFVYPIKSKPDALMSMTFELSSAADHVRYGLLIASPEQVDCGSVQFVISDAYGVVGRSQALQPGEVQVVRIGSYAAGDHALTIAASGCPVQPAAVRRVRLGKPSPDHGWRAAAFVQASFTP